MPEKTQLERQLEAAARAQPTLEEKLGAIETAVCSLMQQVQIRADAAAKKDADKDENDDENAEAKRDAKLAKMVADAVGAAFKARDDAARKADAARAKADA